MTQNLNIVLRYLRRTNKSQMLRIDAICINQADLPERSAEVACISIYFSRASRVVVWLGPESRDSALAVETLRAIGENVDFDKAKYNFSAKPHSATCFLEKKSKILDSKGNKLDCN
jgi:hypothetical protein